MTQSELIGPRRLRRLFADHSFTPRKRFGQNFVIDPNTIRKVVDVAGLDPEDHVLEVGAGAGSLTVALARTVAHVTAVEFDERLVPVLDETVGHFPNVEIVMGDALEVPLMDIPATRMIGNLPYNLAATIVLRVLETAPGVSELTVMTQREVGQRLASPPGSRAFGQTSVLVAYWGTARVTGKISRTAFYPIPNVDSVLLRIVRHAKRPDVDQNLLFAVVRSAFSQRRKTLRNSLIDVAGSTTRAEAALESAGIAPTARAERLGIDEFVALTKALA
jgi:16S rRNA (adenine1518-N6/adenine1519-N6)-dimethyltransferase